MLISHNSLSIHHIIVLLGVINLGENVFELWVKIGQERKQTFFFIFLANDVCLEINYNMRTFK